MAARSNNKYVAFLRGIAPMNPDMQNARLREFFEDLGFHNVQTVISSGNVIFETSNGNCRKLQDQIEKALPEKLNFSSTTIIRSCDQIQTLIDTDPFHGIEDTPKSRLNVTFLKESPHIDLKFPYKAKDKSYKLLGIYEGAICSVIDLSGNKTPYLMLWLEKQFGKEITTRTWKTIHRINNKINKDNL